MKAVVLFNSSTRVGEGSVKRDIANNIRIEGKHVNSKDIDIGVDNIKSDTKVVIIVSNSSDVDIAIAKAAFSGEKKEVYLYTPYDLAGRDVSFPSFDPHENCQRGKYGDFRVVSNFDPNVIKTVSGESAAFLSNISFA